MNSQYDARRWLALAVVLCATLLGVLDFLIVNIAAPSIRVELKATDAQLQLTVAGYGLAYAVCLITGGRLGDIHGRKRLFLIGMAGFTIASAICGLAQNPLQLIIARVVQGLLAAMMTPQVLATIQVTFPPSERGQAIAIMGAVVGIGSFIGNVFGGWLVGANLFGWGWRPIFFVNVPIGILAMIACWFIVPESKSPSARRLDVGGVLISATGLFLLIFPISEGRERGWPLWAWFCIAFSFVVLALFVRFERQLQARGGSPLIDLNLFSDRNFSMGLGGILLLFCGLGSFALVLTFFLQDGLGLSPQQTGITFAPLPVAFLIASLSAVRLVAHFGPKVLLYGLSIMLLSQLALIGLLVDRGGNVTASQIMPLLFLYGIGQGLSVPRLIATVLSDVQGDNAGAASGLLTTTQQVAFSIGVSIIGSAFFSALHARHDAAAYSHALVVAIGCNCVLLAATIILVARLIKPIAAELVMAAEV